MRRATVDPLGAVNEINGVHAVDADQQYVTNALTFRGIDVRQGR
jgi:hypothetical protein